MSNIKKINKSFLLIILTLLSFGFLIFYSASTGLAAQGNLNFNSIILNQLFLGVFLGLISMFIFSKIDYNIIKKYAPIWLSLSIILTLMVFIPGLSLEHGGSVRWLKIGNYTFQPSELLKITPIIFLAAWFNHKKKKMSDPFFPILSTISIVLICSIPLILQRDFDVIILITVPLVAMLIVSKAPRKFSFLIGGIAIIILLATLFFVPHIKSRVMGYINPSENGQTINYQSQQSQIAIGSGGILGKGFGKSTQKFGSLPEPTNDSIFAVLAEEFGILGSMFLIILYSLFGIFGYKIATKSKSVFGALFVTGVITLILFQSFLNIASMLGLAPITGQPLVFVSHGGTSLLITLAVMGIILNISKEANA
jgi:cell division protein FtsW